MPNLIDYIATELKLDETHRNVLLATGARTPEQLLSVLRTSPSLAKRGLVNTALVSDVLSRRGGDAFRAFAAQASEILLHASRFVFGANAPSDAPWQLREEAPGFEEVIAKRAEVEAPKGTIDVRKCIPWPIRDQQFRGTCVAFAMTALREALDCEIEGEIEDLSEQFLYWAIKSIPGEPWPNRDGSTIGFGVGALRDSGICPELQWPYNPHPVGGTPGRAMPTTHPRVSQGPRRCEDTRRRSISKAPAEARLRWFARRLSEADPLRSRSPCSAIQPQSQA